MVDVGMLVCTQGMYNNKKSNFAGQEIFYGPENKMAIPCDTCALAKQCEMNGTECSAFKVWATNGYYNVEKFGKNLKEVA